MLELLVTSCRCGMSSAMRTWRKAAAIIRISSGVGQALSGAALSIEGCEFSTQERTPPRSGRSRHGYDGMWRAVTAAAAPKRLPDASEDGRTSRNIGVAARRPGVQMA